MGRKRRKFSAGAKELAVERMRKGESVSALAREYGVERSRLYQWKDRWETGMPFRESGRPGAGSRVSMVHTSELAAAQARVAELERKVGQQALAMDFLKGALQQVNQSQSTSEGRGATASSATSKE
jgi:transposase-like protein